MLEPSIWQEDTLPSEVRSCYLCELSKQCSRRVWGEGNPDAQVIVLLDNPGCREDKEGNRFVCGTRQTLQTAAYEVGLTQSDLYITYVLKCRPVRKYEKETARSICLGYLEQQLGQNKFKIAFCLGDVAVKAFFGDPQASVKDFRGSWRMQRGLYTFVSYHPLAVRRRPNLHSLFASDWQAVSDKMRVIKTDIKYETRGE